MSEAALREIVDKTQEKASTKRLDISLNELADMYNTKELTINPSFQRNLVWEDYQRSRFIESLLLELPTPPFDFVESSESEGEYELVDGLQRLSSYLHFRGELENLHIDPPVNKGDFLELSDCEIIPQLNGKTWNDIPSSLQFRLKRSFLSVQVIKRTSDRELKYHLFKRLNSGGTQLSDQQIRNCTVRMLGNTFLDFLIRQSDFADYKTCIEPLSSDDRKRQEDQALVLRFYAFKNNLQGFKHDVNPFLDQYAEAVTRFLAGDTSDLPTDFTFDVEKEKREFEKVFTLLAKTTSERSFTFPKPDRRSLSLGFSRYHFEGVITGLAPHIDQLDPEDSVQMSRLNDALMNARLSDEFSKASKGGGRNSIGLAIERKRIICEAVEAML